MHHLRSAEYPVFAWLTLFGEHAASACPGSGSLCPPSRGGHCAEKECGCGGLAWVAGRAASPPRAVRRRPASEEIAVYHRDANTYFALLVFYGVAKCIDTAPPPVALAPQRFLCAILEGYGDSHPVRTRYENAMPCFFYTQVEGMPPHTNDGDGRAQRPEAVHGRTRSVQELSRHGGRCEKGGDQRQRREQRHAGGQGRDIRRRHPEWSIFDGPPADPLAWLPRAGRGGGWDDGRRRRASARPLSARRALPP